MLRRTLSKCSIQHVARDNASRGALEALSFGAHRVPGEVWPQGFFVQLVEALTWSPELSLKLMLLSPP